MLFEDNPVLQEKYLEVVARLKEREEGRNPDGPKPGMNPGSFFEHIHTAKTTEELIRLVDEYDPYKYKIIYVYGHDIKYRGMKVRVQFYKGGPVYDVPDNEVLTPTRTLIGRIKTYFTILKSKRYDK